MPTHRDPLFPVQLSACCAAAYADPVVRWLLGGQLHPGGRTLTLRTLQLARLRPGERLLDVAAGSGDSALLAASELGVEAVGVEYGAQAVAAAQEAAATAGLSRQVSFLRGDAGALPVCDASFDVVLCECSLSTFADKPQAAAELRRVLAPGGRLALSDVVIEGPLPASLHDAIATIACVGDALSGRGYRALLQTTGLTVQASEPHLHDAERFARGIEERLRGARLLGIKPPPEAPISIESAIAVIRDARSAIAAGALGYLIMIAVANRKGAQESRSPTSSLASP